MLIFIRSRWQIIGQFKIHLTDFEEKLSFKRQFLSVHHLDIGRIAFPICMDATYFETFYAAAEQGAELDYTTHSKYGRVQPAQSHTRNMGQVQEPHVRN